MAILLADKAESVLFLVDTSTEEPAWKPFSDDLQAWSEPENQWDESTYAIGPQRGTQGWNETLYAVGPGDGDRDTWDASLYATGSSHKRLVWDHSLYAVQPMSQM